MSTAVCQESVSRPAFIWRLLIFVLVFSAIESILYFAAWWFSPEHTRHWSWFLPLTVSTFWLFYEAFVYWFYLLKITKPKHRPASGLLSVDVFTTAAPGEPLALFEKSLPALKNLRYPHRTYLLDGTSDPAFRILAEQTGVEHIDCRNIGGAKAGKINYALEHSSGDIVLIIDPDHIAEAHFLDRVVGHFDEPAVGFVQVVQAYHNQNASFVARAAAEQTYGFYGPILMGMNGYGGPFAIGANCTFRRKALSSIGGHAVHLVEDIVTSLRLHAEGWKSIYVPEILARGLVPENLHSYFMQQLKWATGMFQTLFTVLPRTFFALRGWQKLSYAMSAVYYCNGLAMLTNILLPIVFLFGGIWAVEMPFRGYIGHILPFVILFLVMHLLAQRWMRHPTERGLQWRGLLLKLGTWPVYVLALLYAVVGKQLPWLPTPKANTDRHSFSLIIPQMLVVLVSLSACMWGWLSPLKDFEGTKLMMFFAVLNSILMLPVLAIAITEYIVSFRGTA